MLLLINKLKHNQVKSCYAKFISTFHNFLIMQIKDIKDQISALDNVLKANETLVVNWRE